MGRNKYQPTKDQYEQLLILKESGIPVSEIANKMGISQYILKTHFKSELNGYKRRLGLKECREKDLTMVNMFKSGETMEQIGKRFGICRERVRQILQRNGLTGKDGGVRIRSAGNKIAKKKRKHARQDRIKREKLGCSIEEWRYFRAFDEDYYKTPIHKYRQQRQNAKSRGIEWNLTIIEWWDVWERSGKWDSMGCRKNSYVMARHGDEGGYVKGNVKITTLSENSKEYYDLHMDEWRQKMIDSHNWDD